MNTPNLTSTLSWIVFTPLIGAAAIFAVRSDRVARWLALATSLVTLALSLALPFRFDSGAAGFQFTQNLTWIELFNIHYHVGVDGISMWLVVLTTLLSAIGVLVSWKGIHRSVRAFFMLLLVLETGMLGVFISLDLFLFYVFWEVTLVPMAFLIGIWGHERRIYAAVKFFLYTMAGSVLMLGCIIWLYNLTGTFDFVAMKQAVANGALTFSPAAEMWLFLGFFIAFAIKVPLFPLHTWLPDAHVEAPTAGSVLLAGVLLKMGPYGMLRFNLGLFPNAARRAAPYIVILGIIGIIYGALVAYVQPNMKKLVAYSSVSHMGFIIVGVFTFTQLGTQGAVYQMLNHGISTGGLFILVGMLYERRHTFELSEYGGIATSMPVYAGFFVLIVMSSAGLPLLNGFVGEFLIMLGAFLARHAYGAVAAVGVIVGAMYLLRWTRETLWGEVSEANRALPDADGRERLVLATIGLIALLMGVAPFLFLDRMAASTRANLAPFTATGMRMTGTIAHRPLPLRRPPAVVVGVPGATPERNPAGRHAARPASALLRPPDAPKPLAAPRAQGDGE
jgi:NADH-quinone oxidoreductase subunit M